MKIVTTLEKLIEGRRRIVEVGWTKGFLGRDADGDGIIWARWDEMGQRASCYCASGAVDTDDDAVRRLEEFIPLSLVGWNDASSRTREEVIALFDKAIEAERAAIKLAGVEG